MRQRRRGGAQRSGRRTPIGWVLAGLSLHRIHFERHLQHQTHDTCRRKGLPGCMLTSHEGLTCLRKARGEGLGIGRATQGKFRDGGDCGGTGETSGTCSRARVSHGWERTEVTEPGAEDHTRH